jgi:hypothetical protein
MNLFHLFIIPVLIVSINTRICFAQRPASALKSDYYNYTDSTKKILPAEEQDFSIDIRMFQDDILKEYENDPDFNYKNVPTETDDWITKIKNWINQQLVTLSSSKTYSTILDYLYYGLMIAALLLIIRGLIKADRRGILFGKVKTNELKIVESEEDIDKINFDELITMAIDSKQYKLAVRYLFLKSLKLLSERGLIELRNNKTNHQYLSELKNNQIADVFRTTTSRFEWIWYGDFPVNEEIVKSSQNDFEKLFVLIKP